MKKNQEITVIEPSRGVFDLKLSELWKYRGLIYLLAWRDIKIRYKQTLLGIGWAVFQPLLAMGVFTLVFGRLAKMPSGGVPYPVFTLCGIAVWNYFSQSVAGGTGSLIQNRNLITKVYFPRMVIPVATVGKGLFDYMIALVIVLVIMAYYGIAPGFQVITFPVWMVLVFFAAAGISMWTSAVSVKYRDLPYTIPFLVQMLFWISPVAYGSQVIPDRYTYLYSLNPMYSVIEGFRWCMLGTPFPEPKMVVISLAMIFVLFFSALIYFRNMERHFADLI